jgi:hypothetical protein
MDRSLGHILDKRLAVLVSAAVAIDRPYIGECAARMENT